MDQAPRTRSSLIVLFAVLLAVVVLAGGTVFLLAQMRDSHESTTNSSTNARINTNTVTNVTGGSNTTPTRNANTTLSTFDTSDWLAYSVQNEFTFRYPSDWQVIALEDPRAGVAVRSPQYTPIREGSVTYEGEMYISSVDNPQNLSAEELFKTFDDTSRFWFTKHAHENVQLGNNRATYFRSFIEEGQARSLILISGTGLIANLDYLYKNDTVRDVFETIASTVTFRK